MPLKFPHRLSRTPVLSANILPGVVKGPSPEGPTGIKKKNPIDQAECDTNNELSMNQAKCVTSDGVQPDVRSGDVGQAECVSKKEKKKVWTRLSNGLYGWRKKCIPKKYLGPEADVRH